jgi:REP element-mobilizing transposase RayT
VAKEELTAEEQIEVLNHVKNGNEKFYALIACIVMPDHVHVVFMADMNCSLSTIMKGIKGVSAYRLNKMTKTKGPRWQTESFDRIVRNENELYETLVYMLNNPVDAGLTNDPWNYHGWYCNEQYWKP